MDYLKQGVYSITNIITNQRYIGSTTMCFKKRLDHHISRLRTNNHKNSYLQHAWNKYGECNFKIDILEICEKEKCLEREQYYLDTYNSLYNINPIASGTPNLSKETIIKRTNSLKEYWKKNGTDKLKGRIPWNKGLKMGKEHCDKLKKSASTRINTKEGLEKRRKAFSKFRKPVLQYDMNMNFIKLWRSSREVEENMKGYLACGVTSCANGNYKWGYYKDFIFKHITQTALYDSNVIKALGEFGESLSLKDMVIPSQAICTQIEGVTTTGELKCS